MARRRGSLRGTPAEHASEAQSFFSSASNNFNRRRNDPPSMSCSNIEHLTDVVAEANVAVIAASHAGDKALEDKASKLMHDATIKQREFVKQCRIRERALAVTGQEGNLRRRRR